MCPRARSGGPPFLGRRTTSDVADLGPTFGRTDRRTEGGDQDRRFENWGGQHKAAAAASDLATCPSCLFASDWRVRLTCIGFFFFSSLFWRGRPRAGGCSLRNLEGRMKRVAAAAALALDGVIGAVLLVRYLRNKTLMVLQFRGSPPRSSVFDVCSWCTEGKTCMGSLPPLQNLNGMPAAPSFLFFSFSSFPSPNMPLPYVCTLRRLNNRTRRGNNPWPRRGRGGNFTRSRLRVLVLRAHKQIELARATPVVCTQKQASSHFRFSSPEKKLYERT